MLVTGVVLSNASLDVAFHDTFLKKFSHSFPPRQPRTTIVRGVGGLGLYCLTLISGLSFSGLPLYIILYNLYTVSIKEEILSENLETFFSNNDNLKIVTYLEQFLVGLLEADGTITVDYLSENKKRVRIIISLNNTVENRFMLNLFVKYIGGRIEIERKDRYVTWYATSRTDINIVLAILKKYPFLSTRKKCQLEFAKQFLYSTEAVSKKEFIQLRDDKYKNQDEMLKSLSGFVYLPSYFPAWLSGFIEGAGHFKFVGRPSDAIKSSQFIIGQNNDKFLLEAILKYFNSEKRKLVMLKIKKVYFITKSIYLEMNSENLSLLILRPILYWVFET